MSRSQPMITATAIPTYVVGESLIAAIAAIVMPPIVAAPAQSAVTLVSGKRRASQPPTPHPRAIRINTINHGFISAPLEIVAPAERDNGLTDPARRERRQVGKGRTRTQFRRGWEDGR